MKLHRLAIILFAGLSIAVGATFLGACPVHAEDKVFRMVPQSDLKFLDPLFTTNYVTRNFSHMVYDMLFSLDAKGIPRPQMVEQYHNFDGGKQWTFVLRKDLKFSDGSAVTAADVVASLLRWQARDNYGRAMEAAGAQWNVTDKNSFQLILKKPFGLVLEALAKTSSLPPVIMPERIIKAAGSGSVTEVIGSGPYIFKREEWVPGNKVVFIRNKNYVGRTEPVSFMSGNRSGSVDRVEWVILPDANSAMAALKNGEVDMIELVPPDYINTLRTDPNIKIGVTGPSQASLIVNTLQPPFNNPQVRQAFLHAVNQEKFVTAMGNPVDMRMKYCATFFICGSVNDTSAGAEAFRTTDLALAKKMLTESGYKGEKVVVLLPTDYASLNGAGLVAIQTMKDMGMKVEVQSMDWPTLVSRRTRKDAVTAGGWSAYATLAVAPSIDSPLSNFMLGAACGNSMPGWPCDKTLDELRVNWTSQRDPVQRKLALDAFQARAYEVLPYIPLGQYSGAYAIRTSVRHLERQIYDIPMLWALEK